VEQDFLWRAVAPETERYLLGKCDAPEFIDGGVAGADAARDRAKQQFPGNRQAPGALGDVMFKSSKVPQAKEGSDFQ
jgi:hypothetical protein